MPNVEQMDYWDGAGGEHWVAEQVRYDEINAEFGARVVAVLAPERGDRVLDVGCGNGALSLAIAPLVAPAGLVLGLDISAPMLEVAAQRAHAARLSNAIFEHAWYRSVRRTAFVRRSRAACCAMPKRRPRHPTECFADHFAAQGEALTPAAGASPTTWRRR